MKCDFFRMKRGIDPWKIGTAGLLQARCPYFLSSWFLAGFKIVPLGFRLMAYSRLTDLLPGFERIY